MPPMALWVTGFPSILDYLNVLELVLLRYLINNQHSVHLSLKISYKNRFRLNLFQMKYIYVASHNENELLLKIFFPKFDVKKGIQTLFCTIWTW